MSIITTSDVSPNVSHEPNAIDLTVVVAPDVKVGGLSTSAVNGARLINYGTLLNATSSPVFFGSGTSGGVFINEASGLSRKQTTLAEVQPEEPRPSTSSVRQASSTRE